MNTGGAATRPPASPFAIPITTRAATPRAATASSRRSRKRWAAVPRLVETHEADGRRLKAQQESHRQHKHPVKRDKVTVGGYPPADVPKTTLRAILVR